MINYDNLTAEEIITEYKKEILFELNELHKDTNKLVQYIIQKLKAHDSQIKKLETVAFPQ